MRGPRQIVRSTTGRRIQQRDIAEAAGVSVSTVSRVLKNVDGISQDVRQRVLEIATTLGYQRDRLEYIHLFVHWMQVDQPGHFHAEIMAGIEAECRKHSIRLNYAVIEPGPDSFQGILETMRQCSDDGFIMIAQGDRTLIEQALAITPRLALISAEHRGLVVDTIMPENYTGALLAMQYLFQYGHHAIMHLASQSGVAHYRHRGYRDALEMAGIPYNPALVLETRLDQEYAYSQMKKFLNGPHPAFSAVFCVSDYTAFGVVRALAEAGLHVPQDVSVIGFDDMPTSAFLVPPLTTVRVEREEMGKWAVQRLLARSIDPHLTPARVELHTKLIERQSVAAPR